MDKNIYGKIMIYLSKISFLNPFLNWCILTAFLALLQYLLISLQNFCKIEMRVSNINKCIVVLLPISST